MCFLSHKKYAKLLFDFSVYISVNYPAVFFFSPVFAGTLLHMLVHYCYQPSINNVKPLCIVLAVYVYVLLCAMGTHSQIMASQCYQIINICVTEVLFFFLILAFVLLRHLVNMRHTVSLGCCWLNKTNIYSVCNLQTLALCTQCK